MHVWDANGVGVLEKDRKGAVYRFEAAKIERIRRSDGTGFVGWGVFDGF